MAAVAPAVKSPFEFEVKVRVSRKGQSKQAKVRAFDLHNCDVSNSAKCLKNELKSAKQP